MQQFYKRIAGTLLGTAMLLGMVAVMSTAANAQRNWTDTLTWAARMSCARRL